MITGVLDRLACNISKVNSFSKHVSTYRSLWRSNSKPLREDSSIVVVATSMPKKSVISYLRVIPLGLSFSFNFINVYTFMLAVSVSLTVVQIVWQELELLGRRIDWGNFAFKILVFLIKLMLCWLCVNLRYLGGNGNVFKRLDHVHLFVDRLQILNDEVGHVFEPKVMRNDSVKVIT